MILLQWLVLSIVPALLQGTAPSVVANATTFITGVVDEGIVAPALIVAGALLLRRTPPGYLLASMMLVEPWRWDRVPPQQELHNC